MPRTSTTTIPAAAMTGEGITKAYSDDELDSLFDGLPEEQREIRLDRIAGDLPAAPMPGNTVAAPPGYVVLRNVKYENEKFAMPVRDQNGSFVFGQDTILEFYNGDLVCTAEQADEIQARAPYVYREPLDLTLPLMTFSATKFSTRVQAAFDEHSAKWAGNQ